MGKLYFYVYPSAFQNPGGGEILLLKTREYIEREGAQVHLFNQWTDRFEKGDLLHVFGSVKEALGLMETAKSKGVKLIHCPIIWYNWQSSLRVAYTSKERLMCIARQTVKYFFPFIPSERKRMMEISDFVLAGSQMEAAQISRYFLIPQKKIRVVPYGADEIYAKADPEIFIRKHRFSNFILMVGRIEPRKNQLNLIRAINESGKELVLIGDSVSHHQDYYEKCRGEAGENVHFLGAFPSDSEELRSAFAACSVFALPTWFETPGLAALEAALAGVKIVITGEGSTREYFKDYVEYVNPADVRDIRRKIEIAMKNPESDVLKKHIQNNFTWPLSAKRNLQVYQEAGFHLTAGKKP